MHGFQPAARCLFPTAAAADDDNDDDAGFKASVLPSDHHATQHACP